jgi:hypothetical protein
MKITTPEERDAHHAYVVAESIKGTLIGGLTSIGVYTYMKRYHPTHFKAFSPTIKACLLIMPGLALCSFWAEEGSRKFDMQMHSELGGDLKLLQEYQSWKNKSLWDQTCLTVKENQVKILVGLYGGSFFVAQELARKKIGAHLQSAAKRNYMLGFTVLFLTILIAMTRPTQESTKTEEWKKYL